MSELPEDLVEEILCCVPALSLTRLRFTCKRWNRMLNDTKFTTKHFHKAPKQFLIHMWKEFTVCPMDVAGEFNLIDLHYSGLGQVKINRVSHCDGLLLCVCVPKEEDNTERLVVWNPCTGQTRWINHNKRGCTYVFGSYQDSKSLDNSYKILSHRSYYGNNQELEIYETSSNSWRILDVPFDFSFFGCFDCGVSLKGKTYWIAIEEKEKLDIFLVSFDYTTEIFERLCLPRVPSYKKVSLSVVREEKLSLLLLRDDKSKTEVWVTNKIGETKGMSWSKVFAVELDPCYTIWDSGSFVVDEEKKVHLCCDRRVLKGKPIVHIVGQENILENVGSELGSYQPSLVYYVPSLTQVIGGKRKRGE